jgi:cytochrome P450
MTEVADQESVRSAAFPMARTCPFDPPPAYGEYREHDPITRIELRPGQPAWLLSRHEDVRAMLNDPRFSSDRFQPGFPNLLQARPPARRRIGASLISMDGAEHNSARREVLGEFTVRRMRDLRPRIQQFVDEHLDAILAGPKPADLVSALAMPVPSLVICELLGVPYADHDFFQQHSAALLNRTTAQQDRVQAVDALQGYLDQLVTAKEADPGDDLIGRQIRKQRESGEVRHDDLVSLGFLLLIAGHETTANMISLGTVALLENPEQLATLKADPGTTLEAVEEMLRYFTITDLVTSRVATEDVQLGGVTIPAGEGVIGLSHSANRDEAAFPNADEFDIERGARHHVAFGFGPHQCLGQNLARMELQIVFDTLFQRIPDLKLAEAVDDLPFKHDSTVFGLYSLPVTW